MEELINEIFKLSVMKVNQVYPIKQGEDIVYLNRSVSGFAIAIPFKDERVFDENFVGITLSTNILNYNGEKMLRQYLPILLENADGADVYVADNASTDNSVNICHSFRDNRIKHIDIASSVIICSEEIHNIKSRFTKEGISTLVFQTQKRSLNCANSYSRYIAIFSL